jgi:2-oxoglutarate ferredoxin oxidoreductase subunit alpha
MRFNVLIGGEAGQGPNILAHTLGRALVRKGFYVFYSRDYESVIRGGHNFNVLTFSNEKVYSNDSRIDILVALNEETVEIHKNKLKKDSVIIKGKGENMYFAGKLFKVLGIEFEILDEELKILEKKYKENLKEAKKGYEEVEEKFKLPEITSILSKQTRFFRSGSMGIAEGAINSGLDIYYAYPMTPATPVMGELAEKQIEYNYIVIELENEIAVANAGIGSAITGAKTMVGTSGGGFDLMSEALSLTGIAEVPLVFYVAQRPGPATGVATYQAQGDLNIARHAGHGEFTRVVVAPGDSKEAEELTTEAFYFSQKFKIPAIVLSDKHVAESFYTTEGKPNLTISEKLTSFARYNSYEKNKEGSATDVPEIVNKNIEERRKKTYEIAKEAEKFEQYRVYGNTESDNVIIAWGSTKGVILDCLECEDVNAKFVQILYIDPFPKEDLWRELIGKNLILIENNSTAQLGQLLKEKTGFKIPEKNKILRYDGRSFLRDELEKEIKKRLK